MIRYGHLTIKKISELLFGRPIGVCAKCGHLIYEPRKKGDEGWVLKYKKYYHWHCSLKRETLSNGDKVLLIGSEFHKPEGE